MEKFEATERQKALLKVLPLLKDIIPELNHVENQWKDSEMAIIAIAMYVQAMENQFSSVTKKLDEVTTKLDEVTEQFKNLCKIILNSDENRTARQAENKKYEQIGRMASLFLAAIEKRGKGD